MQQSSAFPRKQGDCRASLVLQMMRYPPAMQETGVQSLGREEPLEKEMVPPPVFLHGETHGQRSLVGYSPWGHEELDTTEWLIHSIRWLYPGGVIKQVGKLLSAIKKILYSKILNLGEWHIIVSSICHSSLVTKMIKRDVHLYLCLEQQNSSWARVDFHVALDWDELNVGSPSC